MILFMPWHCNRFFFLPTDGRTNLQRDQKGWWMNQKILLLFLLIFPTITLKTPRKFPKFPLLQTLLPLFPLVKKNRNCLIFLQTGWSEKTKNHKMLLLLLPFLPSMTQKIPRKFPKFLLLRTLLPLSPLVRKSRNCIPNK